MQAGGRARCAEPAADISPADGIVDENLGSRIWREVDAVAGEIGNNAMLYVHRSGAGEGYAIPAGPGALNRKITNADICAAHNDVYSVRASCRKNRRVLTEAAIECNRLGNRH